MKETGAFPLELEIAGFRFDGTHLLDMFGEALVIWDFATGEVLYVNDAGLTLYGYSPGEACGLVLGEFFPGWEDVLRTQSFSLLTATHRKKNGIFFPVQVTCRPLSGKGGGVMMMVVSDVSPESLARESVSLASDIQRGFLPGDLDEDGRIEIRGIYRPMFLISGDMYGYHWDAKQGILSGFLFDVMGHGVPAALQTSAIMVLFHQAFEDDVRAGATLEEKLRWVNAMAGSRILTDSFAAAVCFRLNLPEKRMDYCAAGINGFLHGTADGLKRITSPGSLLGLPGDPAFGAGSLPAGPGDYFIFMSDGFLDHLGEPQNGFLSFSEIYDHLFQVGYTGAARDDQSAVCILVRRP